MSGDKLVKAWKWIEDNQSSFDPKDLTVLAVSGSGRTRVKVENPNGLFAKTFIRWQTLCKEAGMI